METIILIGTFLSFFLEFLLLGKKNKSIADKILTIWMFIIGFHLFNDYIYKIGFIETHPQFLGYDVPLPLFHGPFLYLYVLFLTTPTQKSYRLHFLHLTPPIIYYIIMIPFFFKSAEEKFAFTAKYVFENGVIEIVSFIAMTISGVVYISLSFYLLRKYRKNITNLFSYTESINLSWLYYLIIGMTVIWLVIIASISLADYLQLNLGADPNVYIFITVTLFILTIGTFGLKQPGIFTTALPNANDNNAEQSKTGQQNQRYIKSGLKEDQAIDIKKKLINLMKKEKLFLENKLSLNQLAKILNIHPNYLSQIINEHLQVSFYDFINDYRIEEFKEKANHPKFKHYNILSLALECGFNSKSTFNTVFKNKIGITPSNYLQSLSN